jgi:tetratricopeptide (TPR) repeat protein
LAGFNNAVAADVFIYHADNHRPLNNQNNRFPPMAEDRKAYNKKWNYLDTRLPKGKKLYGLMAMEKGIALRQAGHINKALEILSEAITSAPQDPELALTMAEVLVDAGNYQQALETIERNIFSEKQAVRGLELAGYCEKGLERFEAAKSTTDRLLSINPESAPGLNLKGLVVSRHGDKKSAANFFQKALEGDPGYGQAYTNLGSLKQESGQIQEALELFEKGFVLSASDKNSAANYHSSISALNAFDRAEAVFREAVALYPHHKQLAYYLIDVLLKLKKYKPAMEVIKQAIAVFGMEDGILEAAHAIRNKVGPKAIDPTAKQRYAVSLCMIAKNEEAHLSKCLWSADAIVDEIIVVDTGSTDRTKDIAAVFGAKVFEFQWAHDFSAARNISLAKASGDWIFVLDADEVISVSDHADFRKMISRTQHDSVAFEFATRNYTTKVNIIGWKPNDGVYAKEEAASGWTSSEKVRLFPNSSVIRFEYAIHELVEPSLKRKGVTVKRCDIPIHHYGKLSQEKATAKMKPYYGLGKKKLADLEGNVVAIRELAVQAAILGNHHEAVDLWKRFIVLQPNISDGYLYIGASYTQLGQYEAALAASQKALELDPQREEARYNYGISQLYLGNAECAIEALERILQQHPDYLPAEFMLSAAYSCNGRKELGMPGFRRLRKTAIGRELSFRCLDLARCLLLRQLVDYAILLLEAAIESSVVSTDARTLLLKCIQLKETAGATKMSAGVVG